MGSDLYRVRVLDKQDKKVRLGVQVIHPDAMDLPGDKSFALMMLFEAAKTADPLVGEMGLEDSLDPKWNQRHAAGFVTKVAVLSIENPPPEDRYNDPYWNDPEQWMRGEIEITVTHPDWIRHLRKGNTWASRAFQVTARYGRCAPIVPGADTREAKKATKEAKAPKEPGSGANSGFVLVPPEVFAVLSPPKTHLTALEMPAYGDGAYRATDIHTGPEITNALLKKWDGRAVDLVGVYGKTRGALIYSGKQSTVVRMTANGSSYSSGSLEGAKSLGLLELKPKARLGDKLRYETFLSQLPSRVVAVKRAGAKVELTLHLAPLGKLPKVAHTPDALGVLTYGLAHSEFTGAPLSMASLTPSARKAPIVVAAREDMARLGIEWDGGTLCAAIAKGYVLDWNLALPELELPDLDAADLTTVRAFLEQPRPTATLTMTVSDPAWLAHLDPFKPYDLPPDAFGIGAAAPWKGPPRKA